MLIRGASCGSPSLWALHSPPQRLTQPSLAVARTVGAVGALGEGLTPRCHPLPMGWHRESEA